MTAILENSTPSRVPESGISEIYTPGAGDSGLVSGVSASSFTVAAAMMVLSDNSSSFIATERTATQTAQFFSSIFSENISSFTSSSSSYLITFKNVSDGLNWTTSGGLPVDVGYALFHTVVLGLLAGVVSLVTITGNLIVIASFILERTIRQPTNYFIASLAVSDLLIGSVSMPFYTVYLLSGKYWPLGEVLCDLWLSLDYTVCLVSIYTVFCITIDRFCSVKIPAKYRNWRTERKVLGVVCVTWFVPIVIFFTSINGWQHFVGGRTVPAGMCYVQYMEDAIFNMLLQFGYFWITLAVMCSLYAGIYRVALRLQQKSEAKHRKMAALVSVAGTAISKIGIGVTQQSLPQHIKAAQQHPVASDQPIQPHSQSNGASCHGDGGNGTADAVRSTQSINHQVSCVTPMQRHNATPVIDRVAEVNSRMSGTPQERPRGEFMKDKHVDSSPERSSSSSVALSSDSDGAGGMRSGSRKQDKPLTGGLDTESTPTLTNRKLKEHTNCTASRASPADAVDKAVRYVNARRNQISLATREVSHLPEFGKERRIPRTQSHGNETEGVVRTTNFTKPATTDRNMQNRSIEAALRITNSPLESTSGIVNRIENTLLATKCSSGSNDDGGDVCRSMENIDEPVWKHHRQSEECRWIIESTPRQSPSPVWVRRANSQGVFDQRRSPSPPILFEYGLSTGSGCDYATCRGGITSLHRRRHRRQRLGRKAFNRGVDGLFALRRTRTVEFNVDDKNKTSFPTPKWPFNGASESTTSMTFDFRSPVSYDCHNAMLNQQHLVDGQQQRNRLQVPDVQFDVMKPSQWRQPIRICENDLPTRSRQRRLHKSQSSSGEENHRRPKSKRTEDSGSVGERVTRRTYVNVPRGRLRKPFFLATAASALQRRIVSGPLAQVRSRHRRNPPEQDNGLEVVAESATRTSARSSASKTENRALKALRTITIILGVFVLCFTPWHVLSLIMGFCSDDSCVSTTLYDISYWLCYLNSPLNPFCYAFANQQFKKTFLRIIRLDWHRT